MKCTVQKHKSTRVTMIMGSGIGVTLRLLLQQFYCNVGVTDRRDLQSAPVR
jgi:hypothetical protein